MKSSCLETTLWFLGRPITKTEMRREARYSDLQVFPHITIMPLEDSELSLKNLTQYTIEIRDNLHGSKNENLNHEVIGNLIYNTNNRYRALKVNDCCGFRERKISCWCSGPLAANSTCPLGLEVRCDPMTQTVESNEETQQQVHLNTAARYFNTIHPHLNGPKEASLLNSSSPLAGIVCVSYPWSLKKSIRSFCKRCH